MQKKIEMKFMSTFQLTWTTRYVNDPLFVPSRQYGERTRFFFYHACFSFFSAFHKAIALHCTEHYTFDIYTSQLPSALPARPGQLLCPIPTMHFPKKPNITYIPISTNHKFVNHITSQLTFCEN